MKSADERHEKLTEMRMSPKNEPTNEMKLYNIPLFTHKNCSKEMWPKLNFAKFQIENGFLKKSHAKNLFLFIISKANLFWSIFQQSKW